MAAASSSPRPRHRFTEIGHENNEIYRIRSLRAAAGIGAIRESKILGREAYFLDQFAQIERRSFDRQGYYNFLTLLPALGLETIVVVAMLGIVAHLVFITGAAQGLPTIGLLAAAMFRLLPMCLRIMANLQRLNTGKPTLELIAHEIEQSEKRVRDAISRHGSTAGLEGAAAEQRRLHLSGRDGGAEGD